MRIFVDTSAWQTLFDRNEQGHADARRLWRRLMDAQGELITSEYVFDELVTNLQRRAGHPAAVSAGTMILRSPNIRMVDITRARFDRAWDMFQRYEDKGYSFTDVTSFLLIEEHRCDGVFAFDDHFEQAGFRLLRAE